MSPSAGQTSLRTGRNLAPEVEKLTDPLKLRPTVSPGDMRSYEGVRPDIIATPRGDSLFGQLAQALSGYVPVLDRMSAVKEERFREEQIAEGEALQAQNEKDFEAFTAANPEYAGLNPHLKTGYQTARLKRLAMEHNAYMQNWYSTSGAVNIEDPEQATAMFKEASREWQKANLTPTDTEDARLLSRAFSPAVYQGDQALTARYSGDRASETLRHNADEYSKLIAASLEQGLLNTPGIGNPDTLNGFLQSRGEEFSALMQEMMRKGTPHSAAPKIVEGAVLAFAQSLGEGGQGSYGPQVLKMLDYIKGTDGKPLSANPETKARVTAQLKSWRNESRSNMEFYQRQKDRQDREERRESLKTALSRLGEDYTEGRPPTSAKELMKLPGVKDDHWDSVLEARRTLMALRSSDMELDPATQREFALARLKAQRGELDMDGLIMIAGRFGGDGYKELQNIIFEVDSGKSPLSRTMQNADIPRAYRLIHAQLAADPKAAGATPEMLQVAAEETLAYGLQGLEEKAREAAEAGKSLSPWETNSILQTILIEAGKSPVFRDFNKPRDIRHTEEILSRYPETRQKLNDIDGMPKFDLDARIKELTGTPPFSQDVKGKNQVGDLMSSYLANPAEVGRAIAHEYGVGLAQVPGLLDSWAKDMLGVPLSRFAEDIVQKRAREADKRERWATEEAGLFPTFPGDDRVGDKYEQYSTQPYGNK